MTRADLRRLQKIVNDVIFANSQAPGKLDGTYTLELANGCRDLIKKIETVQELGKKLNSEFTSLATSAEAMKQSVTRMKRWADVAVKTIGE